jgi:replication-associated recombination protein RarA
MAAPNNPFLQIVPRRGEIIINQKDFLERAAKETKGALKGGVVIIFSGDYGIGKTLVSNKLKQEIKDAANFIAMDFTNMIADEIRELPLEGKKEIVVIIDRFDLIKGMSQADSSKVLDLILERIGKGITFVLLSTPEIVKYIFGLKNQLKASSVVLDVPPLDYEDAKKLIISRLDEVGEKKGSLEPFTEQEVEEFWKKSKGNPRMLLLLCSSIYDRKMMGP